LRRWLFGLEEKEVFGPVDFVFSFLENNISKQERELFLGDGDSLKLKKLFRGIEVNNGSALEEEFDSFFDDQLIFVGFGGFFDGFGGGEFPGNERDVTLR
jgi:hypothetical protein